MILGIVLNHQRIIYSCYGVNMCDFGPNRGLGIFITDMTIISKAHSRLVFGIFFTFDFL